MVSLVLGFVLGFIAFPMFIFILLMIEYHTKED